LKGCRRDSGGVGSDTYTYIEENAKETKEKKAAAEEDSR